MSGWLDNLYARKRAERKRERCGDPWAFAKKEKPDKKSGWLDGDWTKKEKRSDDPWVFEREEKE